MSATDEDGPLNSAIIYSLVGGNQLGHFAIDPKKGELQVAKALDWEQVSSMGGAQSELIKAYYSPAIDPEYELWSTPHPDTSPDLPSFVFSVRPEAGEGPLTFPGEAQASFSPLTRDHQIIITGYHLSSTCAVPGTLLSALHSLCHLVFKIIPGGGSWYHPHRSLVTFPRFHS